MIENSEGYEQLLTGLFPPTEQNKTNDQANSNLIKPTFSQQYQTVDKWLNQNVSQFSAAYRQREQLSLKLKDQFRDVFQFINVMNNPSKTSVKNTTDPENAISPNGIDYDGFLPISVKFNPDIYYQNHPRVSGAYDGDYQGFDLQGEQHESLLTLITYLQEHNVQFVFLNQPLTDVYLDPVRTKYEQEFTRYIQNLSANHPIIFRDFVNRKSWQSEYQLFSDPSHLNRYGAYQVSQELAADSMINWGSLKTVTNTQ
jgi:hypothetical protein